MAVRAQQPPVDVGSVEDRASQATPPVSSPPDVSLGCLRLCSSGVAEHVTRGSCPGSGVGWGPCTTVSSRRFQPELPPPPQVACPYVGCGESFADHSTLHAQVGAGPAAALHLGGWGRSWTVRQSPCAYPSDCSGGERRQPVVGWAPWPHSAPCPPAGEEAQPDCEPDHLPRVVLCVRARGFPGPAAGSPSQVP